MDTRPVIRLSEHVKACQVLALELDAAVAALLRVVRTLAPSAEGTQLPSIDGARWLMPPSTYGTRFLLKWCGTHTAILSNDTVPARSAPLSYQSGGIPVYSFVWRASHRYVAIDDADGSFAGVQVLKDPDWKYMSYGDIPWEWVREARGARKVAERLTADHVASCLRAVTGADARGLWTTGDVRRVELRAARESEAPWPTLDDLVW